MPMDRPVLYLEQSPAAYRSAVRMAVVAGVFSLLVGALMAYDYARRWQGDPNEHAAYVALKAAAAEQPDNQTLKTEIQRLDEQLRREYFRQRALMATGAVLLVISTSACVAFWRLAVVLRRRLPQPAAAAVRRDDEAEFARPARWAVAGLGAVLLVAAAGLFVWAYARVPAGALVASNPPSTTGNTPTGTPGRGPTGQTPGGGGQPGGQTPGPPTPPPAGPRVQIPDEPPAAEEIQRNWPRFRGPGGLGISAYTDVPTTWDAASGRNILWKTKVPLPGNGSPVVWGDRVFLSGADEKRREVYCFDTDSGTLLWQKPVPATALSTAGECEVSQDTGYAAPTVAADGRVVCAVFANGDLAAFDFQGNLAWSHSFGIPENAYGHASSLVAYKNLLFVQIDQAAAKDKLSKLYALDIRTGKVVWQVDREVPNSWTTPIVIHAAQRDQLITAADPWVLAYDPSDGTELWRADCLRQDVGPSPTFADGVVYVATEYRCLSAIRADGRGDVTETHILWQAEDGLPDTCSPLVAGGHMFVLASYGIFTCYDAEKGEWLWEMELDGNFQSSPGLVGKLVYVVSDEGKAWVIEPGPSEGKITAEADLGERCVTSPAFQPGRIYLRGEEHLFCIGAKEDE